MKKKIADFVVGCWYVCVSYLNISLVRFGLRAPDADPSILPFEE